MDKTKESLKITLGRELKRLRKNAGLTQIQLAELINWSQSAISRAEGGQIKDEGLLQAYCDCKELNVIEEDRQNIWTLWRLILEYSGRRRIRLSPGRLILVGLVLVLVLAVSFDIVPSLIDRLRQFSIPSISTPQLATPTEAVVLVPTATATLIPSRTPAPALSRTPAAKPSKTPTPKPTPTSTSIPGPTSTPTITFTPTPIPSPTSTPTITATPTKTPSPTPTRTATPTRSSTPTETPTPTITLTPTNTPVPTTEPGSILELGETWVADKLALTLTEKLWKPTRYTLRVTFSLQNRTEEGFYINVYNSSFVVISDTGVEWEPWSRRDGLGSCMYCQEDFIDLWLSPVEPYVIERQFGYGTFPTGAQYFDVIVEDVYGLIENAQWRIYIPRP